ncbi:MAG: MBL fold metallo-hydrolase, partial [Clostridia bacterium]|nr:MBL fold metallo-hydrolase [Clostridia bacterium]
NFNMQKASRNLSAYMGEGFEIAEANIILKDGDKLTIDGIELTAIATPGHTDGGMCYLAEGNLFSGDTLFKRSVGRWDFPTGDGQALIKSIKEKLYTLPDNTVVYSGHGEKTEIGYEKKFNMYVNE